MTAHCTVACAGAVMMLAMIMSSISVGLHWWKNSEDSNEAAQNLLGASTEVRFSLWEMEMTTAGVTVKAKHDDMCSISGDSDAAGKVTTYCNKIRAARATTIMTAVFALASVVTLLYGYCNNLAPLICAGLFTSGLTIANAASGVALGVELKKGNLMLDSPMFWLRWDDHVTGLRLCVLSFGSFWPVHRHKEGRLEKAWWERCVQWIWQ